MSQRLSDQEVRDLCWSDLHKDVFGCRPGRHQPNPTREEYDALVRRLDIEMEYERRGQIAAQHRFEKSIEYFVRGQFGLTRLEATRVVVNRALELSCDPINPSLDCSDHSDEIDDFGRVCYELDVCYGLEEQIKLQYQGIL